MTYGEYYYRFKHDMRLVNGSWISTPPVKKIPSQMGREEASLYYTLKLREYWDRAL